MGAVADYRCGRSGAIVTRRPPPHTARSRDPATCLRTERARAFDNDARIEHPDAGAPKLAAVLANPVNYFELTFQAEAGRAYHPWLRGRAAGNSWANDSVFVQFDDSIDANGAAVTRIGPTNAAIVRLEGCINCGVSGWGWQDTGFGAGVIGPDVRFARTGVQRIRVQTREDGFSIDQIVLSPATPPGSPGALKNDTTMVPR